MSHWCPASGQTFETQGKSMYKDWKRRKHRALGKVWDA
jgi:hypothetical protein